MDPIRRSVLVSDVNSLKPSATVAEDGRGQFKSIQEAVNKAPSKNVQPYVILIKAGTYKEYVEIPRHHNNIVFVGEGVDKTKITGNKNYADKIGTFHTPTVGKSSIKFSKNIASAARTFS